MRFSYFVLAAAVALLAGCNDVSAASSSTQKLGEVNSANTVAVRALAAEEPDVDTKKNLRADKSPKEDEDDDEDKGLFDYLSDRYKAKMQYRAWYRARMAPKEVTKLLRAREAEGRYVNWDLAEGYDTYYDRRRNSLLYW